MNGPVAFNSYEEVLNGFQDAEDRLDDAVRENENLLDQLSAAGEERDAAKAEFWLTKASLIAVECSDKVRQECERLQAAVWELEEMVSAMEEERNRFLCERDVLQLRSDAEIVDMEKKFRVALDWLRRLRPRVAFCCDKETVDSLATFLEQTKEHG